MNNIRLMITLLCFSGWLSTHAKLVSGEDKSANQNINPLIGTWEWTNIKNSCNETYIFATDGSSYITSGKETSKASYKISEKPSEKGFYKVTLKIEQDLGGVDCSEETADNTGQEYTNYLSFHPSGNQYVVCEKETTDSCVGPLRKLK